MVRTTKPWVEHPTFLGYMRPETGRNFHAGSVDFEEQARPGLANSAYGHYKGRASMNGGGPTDDEVFAFIAEKIDTVPHIEALLLLWKTRPPGLVHS